MVKNWPAMQQTQIRSLRWEDSPGEGNGNQPQHSCLENPVNRGAWWATVHGVAKSRTRLSDQHFTFSLPVGHLGSPKYVILVFKNICNTSAYIVCLVTQSCPTLCNPIDCSPPGSSIHGILQARILEWVVVPFSRGSSRPRDQTWAFCIAVKYCIDLKEHV